MNRTKAIKEHCLDCAGESDKELVLCCLFDCPLWQYRTGHDLRSKTYQTRMMKYKTLYADELERMRISGCDIKRYFEFGEPRKSKGNPNFGRRKK
jgi:hypothetical protein